jgi:CRP/FNR family cyclic AMP-dependent transcriptional regulator
MVLNTMAEELSGHRFFNSLPIDIRTRLADCANNVVFEAGATICSEGTPATGFFAIRSGRVNVGMHVPNKGLAVLETLHSGDVFGWSWLFAPYRWPVDVVALEQVRAIELHANCLLPYLEEHPAAGYELMKAFAVSMDELIQSARVRLLDLYGSGNVGSG